MGSPQLSILICGLEDREEQRYDLIDSLVDSGDVLEILEEVDNGELAIGDKRNRLLERARGAYIAYVDDDDEVADDYVTSILQAVQSGPDVVGIDGLLRLGDGTTARFCHSIQFAGWYKSGDVFYRTPNHLNPVRRDLALRVKFNSFSSFGEDQDYSKRLHPLLKTEVYLDDHPLYFYNCPNYTRQALGLST